MGPGPAAVLAAPLLAAREAAALAAAAELQWRGLWAEGARAAGSAAWRPQDLLCSAGLAAAVAVPLHFVPRCFDHAFTPPPVGFVPTQPLRLLPWPRGTVVHGALVLLATAVDGKNAVELTARGLPLAAAAVGLSALACVVLQLVRGLNKAQPHKPQPAPPASLAACLLARHFGELRRLMGRGGVATHEWLSLLQPQATVQAPWVGAVAPAALLWARDLGAADALCGLLGLLLSVRLMYGAVLGNFLGGAEVGDRPLREKAARAVLPTARRFGTLALAALDVFVVASLAAQLSGVAVVCRAAGPMAAAALQLPSLVACVRALAEWWRKFGDFPSSFRCELLRVVAGPLAFLAPGGLNFHSPLGLTRFSVSPRRAHLVQALSQLAALALCFGWLPPRLLPGPVGVFAAGARTAFRDEFLAPSAGLFYGGILRRELGGALLRACLLVVWVPCAALQVCGSLALALGGHQEDHGLLQLVDAAAEEIALWCEAQESREPPGLQADRGRSFSLPRATSELEWLGNAE